MSRVVCGKIKEGTVRRFLEVMADLVPGVEKGSKDHAGMRRIVATKGFELQVKTAIDQWNEDPHSQHMDPERMGPPRWECAITTVPSRFALYRRTLISIVEAGFDNITVFVDGPADPKLYKHPQVKAVVMRERNLKTYPHWALTASELYFRNPDASRYAMFQDDFLILPNTRLYLDQCEYPDKGYWNLFTFNLNEGKQGNEDLAKSHGKGWLHSNQRGHGALALVFNNETFCELLGSPHLYRRMWDHRYRWRNVDGAIIESLRGKGWTEWIHSPGFVQHTGHESATRPGKKYDSEGYHPPMYYDALDFARQQPHSPGLGDRVEQALTAVGITKERVEAWVGAPCNCSERQEKLNELGRWASKVLSGVWKDAKSRLDHILGEVK